MIDYHQGTSELISAMVSTAHVAVCLALLGLFFVAWKNGPAVEDKVLA